MDFKFNIVDGQNLNKYKTIKYINYYFIILLIYLLNPLKRSKFNNNSNYKFPFNVATWVGLNIKFLIFLLIIAALLAFYLHFKSEEFKIIGNFTFDGYDFKINNGKKNDSIALNQINNISILRGATWHLNHHKNHYLIKTDNWIELNYNLGEKIKFEFSIESKIQNEHFEEMVGSIYDSNINIDYKSI